MFNLSVILFTSVALQKDISMQEGSRVISELVKSIELLVVKSLIDTLLAGVAVQEGRLELVIFNCFVLFLFLRGLTTLGGKEGTSKWKGR